MQKIYDLTDDGKIIWHPHKFQMQMLKSRARLTYVPKGWRGGFTSWAPKILEFEMKRCGPGDKNLAYFLIAPTLKVATKPGSIQPSIASLFCTYLQYATYNASTHTFSTTEDGERKLWGHAQRERTPIVVCYAEDPDSFASATFLGGMADEVGQKKFSREAANTLRSRMATTSGMVAPNNPPEMKGMKCGRLFAGSTVYTQNWFVQLYEDWKEYMLRAQAEMEARCAAEPDPCIRKALHDDFNQRAYYGTVHPEMTFIRFDSTANPTFPKDEMNRLREIYPDWYFDMRMRAIPRRPAGIIFEAFDQARHFVDPFHIPKSWPRHVAVDFGQKNFYATFWAHDEERDRHICYMSYHRTDLDSCGHGEEIMAQLAELGQEVTSAVAGQISEHSQRTELAMGGLYATPPPFRDLWQGIDLAAMAFKCDKVLLFRNKPYKDAKDNVALRDGFEVGAEGLASELRTYSRPIDTETGMVLQDELPEDKETYHWVDTLRYHGTKHFSATMRSNRQNTARAAAVNPEAPRPSARPDPMAPVTPARAENTFRAAAMAGSSRWQESLFQKYGDHSVLQPHLDIDLN